MRMRWPLIATAAALTALAGAAAAHHSFTATYFEDRTMEIEGKLLQFMFRNPHSFVHVEAPDENGADAPLGRRVGRRRPALGAGRDEPNAARRRRRLDHGQSRPRSRPTIGCACSTCVVPPTASSGAEIRARRSTRPRERADTPHRRLAVPGRGRAYRRRARSSRLVGEWAGRYHEDQGDRVPGDVQGDFTGVPLNDAARRYAEAFDVTRVAVLEHQCQPYNVAHIYRGPIQFRVFEDKNPATQEIVAYRHVQRHVHAVAHDLDGRPAASARATCRTRTWASRPASGTATSSRSRRRTSRKSSTAAAASRAAT